ncbi:hypothetical protein CCAX7_13770 [Capsulimonas corticalis]|uniref:Uncharacterized protein n=1 Tax=Capsulimonas corticalis TaxID=2219043 RepID=A0A9N7L102_9BACT|nr:hypothetical protein CCAX7_13770 [Capsulimonas corticalis]
MTAPASKAAILAASAWIPLPGRIVKPANGTRSAKRRFRKSVVGETAAGAVMFAVGGAGIGAGVAADAIAIPWDNISKGNIKSIERSASALL